MSTVTDEPFDPFDLLGIQKAELGQELSYGHLLVPTKPGKEKHGGAKALLADANFDLASMSTAMLRNQGVSR